MILDKMNKEQLDEQDIQFLEPLQEVLLPLYEMGFVTLSIEGAEVYNLSIMFLNKDGYGVGFLRHGEDYLIAIHEELNYDDMETLLKALGEASEKVLEQYEAVGKIADIDYSA